MSEGDELILTNSSIFGPFKPLAPIFERMASSSCDFWGMTESFENVRHLQSYFLVFRRRVLQSADFKRFWDSVLPYKDKGQTTRAYELGLTIFLTERGFTGEAALPHSALPQTPLWKRWRHQPPLNPLLAYPAALLEMGMPFVKVAVLRDNLGRVPLEPLYRLMEAAGYEKSLIEF